MQDTAAADAGAIYKVLNVGGNNKSIEIPECFKGWCHELLDIDPLGTLRCP